MVIFWIVGFGFIAVAFLVASWRLGRSSPLAVMHAGGQHEYIVADALVSSQTAPSIAQQKKEK